MATAVNDIPSVEFHLQLKRSQFKVPIELIKKNFKNIQKLIEKNDRAILKLIKSLNAISDDPDNSKKLEVIKQLKSTQENHIKKLKMRVAQHNEFINRLEIRISKLKDLQKLENELRSSVSKGADETRSTTLNTELREFYSNEINLMVIAYLIRTASSEKVMTGKVEDNVGVLLAKKLKLDKLIDYDVILQGLNIYNEIRYNKNLKLLIEWCGENKKALKSAADNQLASSAVSSSDSSSTSSQDKTNLEFETYFQQFIELVKSKQLYKALDIASTHLISYIKEDEHIKKEFQNNMMSGKESGNKSNNNNNNNNNGNDHPMEDYDADDDESNDDNSNSDTPDDNFEKIKSGAALLFWNSININDILSTYTHSALPAYSANEAGFNSVLYKSANKSKAFYDQNRPILSKIGHNIKPYAELLDENKWIELADFFLYNFNLLYGIDHESEFLIMLSIGISALKTKSCSNHNHNMIDALKGDLLSSNPIVSFDEFLHSEQSPLGITNCPICSTELFELSSRFPFSHQVKSNIYDNPIMLPNGNLYQLDNLIKFNENYQMSAASNNDSLMMSNVERPGSNEDADSGKSALYSDYDGTNSDYTSDSDDSALSDDDNDIAVFGMPNSSLGFRKTSVSSGFNDRRNSTRKSFVDAVEWLSTLADYKIRDPVTGENFAKTELVKVFPT